MPLSEDDAKDLLKRLNDALPSLCLQEGRLITLLEFIIDRITNLEARYRIVEYIWKKYGAGRKVRPMYPTRTIAAKYGGYSR